MESNISRHCASKRREQATPGLAFRKKPRPCHAKENKMARKPSTRKRREPAPAASTRAEPAASNKRPTTKPGAACLERVLTRDATHFDLVAQLVEWCGCAAPLAALDATSTTCADAARTPVKLALTTATEANPLASLVRSHASRRKLSMAAAGRRLVVIEAPALSLIHI